MALSGPSAEFNDPEVLQTCLQMLGDEASKDEQCVALETLLKLCKNIEAHPGEEKYQKIRKENKTIHDKLLRFDGVKEFMLAMGWTEIEDFFMFLDDHDLSITISILEEYLNTLPPPSNTNSAVPSPVSAVSSNKTSVWTDEEVQKRERKIEEDKRKRMEEYKRMKREREEIKRQINEDRKDTNAKEMKDSHARHLNSHTIKKFENQGGG